MLRIVVLMLFTGGIALAQQAKTLPGGAVLKPERPLPVRPLKPAPEPTPASPSTDANAPSLAGQMAALAPLVGNFSGALASGSKVRVMCQAVAADTWLRCDVAVDRSAALVAVGWDDRVHRFNAFVGDSTGKSTLYKGRLAKGKLVLSGPRHVSIDLSAAPQVTVTVDGETVTLQRDHQ